MKDGFTFVHETKGLVRCWVESGNVTTVKPAPISNAKWFLIPKRAATKPRLIRVRTIRKTT